MTTKMAKPVTELLAAVGRGDAGAQNRLWSLVYDELHRVAQRQMAGQAAGRTLQTTILVHEAYFRLLGDGEAKWANRRHFFGAAAKAMRQIRIDDARKRMRLKRGGGRPVASLDAPGGTDSSDRWDLAADPGPLNGDPAELLALDEALSALEKAEPRAAEIVMLRYFAGLSGDEVADALGVAQRTVDNEWRFARAWLRKNLAEE